MYSRHSRGEGSSAHVVLSSLGARGQSRGANRTALLINVVIFFGISAFIVWQLSAGLLGAFTPEPPDPLAF